MNLVKFYHFWQRKVNENKIPSQFLMYNFISPTLFIANLPQQNIHILTQLKQNRLQFEQNKIKKNSEQKMQVKLIPLFIELQHQKQDQITSSTIPDTTMTINDQLINLLNKHHPISIISSLVHSQTTRNYVRKILMLNIKNEQTNDAVMMINKFQTGYNSIGESYSWIYFEMNPLTKSKLIPMVTSISCSLFYQAQSSENDGIYLQQIVQNFKSLTGKIPNIYYLTHSIQTQKPPKPFNFPYTPLLISQQFKKQSIQQNIISPSSQTNRKIFNDNFILQTKKNKPIPSSVLCYYFKKYELQTNFNPIQKPQTLYQQSLIQLQLQLKKTCISQYKQTMLKLYQDKKFISFKLLYSSHQIAMDLALQSIQKIGCIDDHNFKKQIHNSIHSQLNQIIQEVSDLNLKWTKNYIESQFAHIENRLKTKEFKQPISLKHQLNNFIDSFHRKVELIHCKKIQQYFQHFLVQKIIDNCFAIFEQQKKISSKQFNDLRNQLSALQLSDKQYKKQKTKQSSQTSTMLQQLTQKLTSSKNREQFLQSTLTQLNQQKATMDLQYDKKIQQINQTFLQQLKTLQQAKSTVMEQISNLKMKIVILEANVQQQKQMHLQTHHQYQLMLNQFRAKEMHLQNEISEITTKTNQQLNQSRKYLQQEQHQNSLTKSEKEHQTRKLSQNLVTLTKKYSQLQKNFINYQQQAQKKLSQLQQQTSNVQLALKTSQQKIITYQQQIQQNSIQIDTLLLQKTQKQQQIAVIKQQSKQQCQKIKQLQTKYENEKNNNYYLKNNLNNLNNKIYKNQKNKINTYVQTQYHQNFKKQLENALKMTINLQNQYKKIKNQNSKLKSQLQ